MVAGGSIRLPIASAMGYATASWSGKKIVQMTSSPVPPPPGIPDMATEENTATMMAMSALPVEKSMPKMPNRNATFTMADIDEPSMCIVAPRGRTMSVTSLWMPVSSATSMFVGIVATEEQVPNDTAAGRKSLENMTFAAPLPPPKRA